MSLRSGVGIPTFGLNNSNTLGTTIELFWGTRHMNDIIIAGKFDNKDITNHFSDHQSSVTSLSLPPSPWPRQHLKCTLVFPKKLAQYWRS